MLCNIQWGCVHTSIRQGTKQKSSAFSLYFIETRKLITLVEHKRNHIHIFNIQYDTRRSVRTKEKSKIYIHKIAGENTQIKYSNENKSHQLLMSALILFTHKTHKRTVRRQILLTPQKLITKIWNMKFSSAIEWAASKWQVTEWIYMMR